MKNRLDPAMFERIFAFDQYYQLVQNLVDEKKTTGLTQSEMLAHNTKLNFQRLKRIIKTLQLSHKIKQTIFEIESEMLWIVVVEAWCGDVPQHLPYFNAISEFSDKVRLKVILRDENPEIMDRFLTNGTRSIPILICVNPDTGDVIGTWGPRPAGAMEIVQKLVKNPEITKDMRNEAIQRWYLENKGQELQEELSLLIRKWDTSLIQGKLAEIIHL
jgi:hypothetical protein